MSAWTSDEGDEAVAIDVVSAPGPAARHMSSPSANIEKS